MSPFDQRLRANLVHVDVEGGSGMIFATAVTKMLQWVATGTVSTRRSTVGSYGRAAAETLAFRAFRFVPYAHWRQRQDGDNSTALPPTEQAGGAVNGR